jgi:hypothetical protein
MSKQKLRILNFRSLDNSMVLSPIFCVKFKFLLNWIANKVLIISSTIGSKYDILDIIYLKFFCCLNLQTHLYEVTFELKKSYILVKHTYILSFLLY